MTSTNYKSNVIHVLFFFSLIKNERVILVNVLFGKNHHNIHMSMHT